jgi:hypothetical protein
MARLVNAAPAEARRQSEILRSAQNDSSDIRRRPARVILREAKNLALRLRCQLGPPTVILSEAKNPALTLNPVLRRPVYASFGEISELRPEYADSCIYVSKCHTRERFFHNVK